MRTVIIALSALLLSATLYGQQDMGAITGVVTDESGALVAGARVVATDTGTGQTRAVQTQVTGA